MSTVIIYNADQTPLGQCTIKHAIGMIVREVAEPHEWDEGRQYGPFPLLTSVRLVAAKYVYPKWLDRPASWNADLLRKRDRHTCAYCGRFGRTVEHIVPQAHGGPSTWTNTVVACEPCNGRKRDRTPEQAGMTLRIQPWVPTLRQVGTWR